MAVMSQEQYEQIAAQFAEYETELQSLQDELAEAYQTIAALEVQVRLLQADPQVSV